MKSLYNLFISAFICFLGISFNMQAQINQQDAYNLVLSTLSPNKADTVEIFAYKQLIPAKTSISAGTSTIISPDQDAWLFFVNETPRANWGHPCYYIFVCANKEIKNIEANFYPTNPSLMEMDQMKESIVTQNARMAIDIKNEESEEVFYPASAASTDHKYAVIISGGGNMGTNYVRYWNDCSSIYKTLVNKFGYDPTHINVLISDGTSSANDRNNNGVYDSSPLDLDGNGTNDIQYAATYANVERVFSNLTSTLTSSDQLFIFTIDHGALDPSGEAYLVLWNDQPLLANRFASWINQIQAKAINIVMGQCNSGGFIPYLSNNPKVCISTACKANEASYAMTNGRYDEYVYYWTEAVTKVLSGQLVGDMNGDYHVTAYEAFHYAKSHDTRPETPLIQSTDLFSYFVDLNDVLPRTTNGRISVANGETYNYSGMEAINRPIPLSKYVTIQIDYPAGLGYTWRCTSGNPVSFNGSGTTATLFANANSVSPIVITATVQGSTLTQNFRLYLNNTYSIRMDANSSVLNVDLENEEVISLTSKSHDSYAIYNINGVKYTSGLLNRNNAINVSSLTNGMYIIVIDNGERILQREQFQVNH